MSAGRDLRVARERMGLSLQEAALRARIPVRYLDALERDDAAAIGPGPFASGYTRQYRRFLSLPDAPLPPAEPDPEHTLPTQTAPLIPSRPRLFALAGAVAIALVLATLVGRSAMDAGEPPVGVPPDQVVLITSGEPLRATVVADGREIHSGPLAPGQQHRFEAHDRLELDLARLNAVNVVYNGNTLKPLGAQSRPRRLVFIDDRGK